MLFSASIYNLYFFNLAAVMADPMFATCCESIIGCRTCVELWLVTSDHCLKCRAGDFENKIHEVKGLSAALSLFKERIIG
jgi:hypothetical protein